METTTQVSKELIDANQPRLADGFVSLANMAKQNVQLDPVALVAAETCLSQTLALPTKKEVDRLMSSLNGVARDLPDIVPDPEKQLGIMRMTLKLYPYPIAEAGLKMALAKASPKYLSKVDINKYCNELMELIVKPVTKYVGRYRALYDAALREERRKQIWEEQEKRRQAEHEEEVRKERQKRSKDWAEILNQNHGIDLEECRLAAEILISRHDYSNLGRLKKTELTRASHVIRFLSELNRGGFLRHDAHSTGYVEILGEFIDTVARDVATMLTANESDPREVDRRLRRYNRWLKKWATT